MAKMTIEKLAKRVATTEKALECQKEGRHDWAIDCRLGDQGLDMGTLYGLSPEGKVHMLCQDRRRILIVKRCKRCDRAVACSFRVHRLTGKQIHVFLTDDKL